jgi:hypothetical protein
MQAYLSSSLLAGGRCARLEGAGARIGGLEVAEAEVAGENKTSPELGGPASCERSPGEMIAS